MADEADQGLGDLTGRAALLRRVTEMARALRAQAQNVGRGVAAGAAAATTEDRSETLVRYLQQRRAMQSRLPPEQPDKSDYRRVMNEVEKFLGWSVLGSSGEFPSTWTMPRIRFNDFVSQQTHVLSAVIHDALNREKKRQSQMSSSSPSMFFNEHRDDDDDDDEVADEEASSALFIPDSIVSEILVWSLPLIPGVYNFRGFQSFGSSYYWDTDDDCSLGSVCTLKIVISGDGRILGGIHTEGRDQFEYRVIRGSVFWSTDPEQCFIEYDKCYRDRYGRSIDYKVIGKIERRMFHDSDPSSSVLPSSSSTSSSSVPKSPILSREGSSSASAGSPGPRSGSSLSSRAKSFLFRRGSSSSPTPVAAAGSTSATTIDVAAEVALSDAEMADAGDKERSEKKHTTITSSSSAPTTFTSVKKSVKKQVPMSDFEELGESLTFIGHWSVKNRMREGPVLCVLDETGLSNSECAGIRKRRSSLSGVLSSQRSFKGVTKTALTEGGHFVFFGNTNLPVSALKTAAESICLDETSSDVDCTSSLKKVLMQSSSSRSYGSNTVIIEVSLERKLGRNVIMNGRVLFFESNGGYRSPSFDECVRGANMELLVPITLDSEGHAVSASAASSSSSAAASVFRRRMQKKKKRKKSKKKDYVYPSCILPICDGQWTEFGDLLFTLPFGYDRAAAAATTTLRGDDSSRMLIRTRSDGSTISSTSIAGGASGMTSSSSALESESFSTLPSLLKVSAEGFFDGIYFLGYFGSLSNESESAAKHGSLKKSDDLMSDGGTTTRSGDRVFFNVKNSTFVDRDRRESDWYYQYESDSDSNESSDDDETWDDHDLDEETTSAGFRRSDLLTVTDEDVVMRRLVSLDSDEDDDEQEGVGDEEALGDSVAGEGP